MNILIQTINETLTSRINSIHLHLDLLLSNSTYN